MGAPVDYDELFPGRFLKAGLIEKPVTLKIKSVELEELPQDDGKTRPRGIISFERTEKQLVLNSTNGQCFKALFGRKVQEWVGHRVTLCAAEAAFGGKRVPAVRVYGSPELDSDITVNIELPRRKPLKHVLRSTKKPSTATQKPQQQAPAEESDGGYRADFE